MLLWLRLLLDLLRRSHSLSKWFLARSDWGLGELTPLDRDNLLVPARYCLTVLGLIPLDMRWVRTRLESCSERGQENALPKLFSRVAICFAAVLNVEAVELATDALNILDASTLR